MPSRRLIPRRSYLNDYYQGKVTPADARMAAARAEKIAQDLSSRWIWEKADLWNYEIMCEELERSKQAWLRIIIQLLITLQDRT